jgi:hypothetical protein
MGTTSAIAAVAPNKQAEIILDLQIQQGSVVYGLNWIGLPLSKWSVIQRRT